MIHFLPMLDYKISTAPSWVHWVTSKLISTVVCLITVEIVQVRRRRSSKMWTFDALIVRLSLLFIQKLVRSFEGFVQSTIVEEWRGFATVGSRDCVELFLSMRSWRFAPEFSVWRFAMVSRWIGIGCGAVHEIIVIRRHFLEISKHRLDVILTRSPFLGRRSKLMFSHRVPRLVRRRAQRGDGRRVQIEIVWTNFAPNHRRVDTRRTRIRMLVVMMLMLLIDGRGKGRANEWQGRIRGREILGRLQFSTAYRETWCELLQG